MRVTLAILVGAIMLCAPHGRVLASDSDQRIAVLPVELGSKLPRDARNQFQVVIEEAFGAGQWEVVPSKRLKGLVPRKRSCSGEDCMARVASKTSSAFVVRTRAQVRDRVYTFNLEVYAAAGFELLANGESICEICGVAEAADQLAQKAAAVRQQLEVRLQTGIIVESAPEGATVLIDGEVVGETPFEARVDPGAHAVWVIKPGYMTVQREVMATNGDQQTVEVALKEPAPTIERPAPAPLGSDRRTKHVVGWGSASLVAGVGMLAAGIPLLLLHDRQYQRRCSGDDEDINGTCRFSYDTVVGGAVLTAGGVAMAAAGTALLVVGLRAKKASKRPVSAFVGPTGLGLRGQF